MKYIENLELEKISNYLSSKALSGGRVLNARIEIYSTKRAGDDKKVYKAIEQRILGEASTTPSPSIATVHDAVPQRAESSASASSKGSGIVSTTTGEKKAIKLHVDLIQTLNSSLIDYDFTELSMESFKNTGIHEMVGCINNNLAEITAENPSFLTEMWRQIDTAINLSKCEGFTLPVGDEAFPFSLSDPANASIHLWSFIYLIVNKELKRICLFTCHASAAHASGIDMYMDDDDDAEDDMHDTSDDDDDDEMETSSIDE